MERHASMRELLLRHEGNIEQASDSGSLLDTTQQKTNFKEISERMDAEYRECLLILQRIKIAIAIYLQQRKK
jgi:hypothetical protein